MKGEKNSFELWLQIPTKDLLSKKAVSKNDVRSEFRDMIKQFPSSVKGKILGVSYSLKVYVRHKAWNDWGGYYVNLPITVR